MDAPKATETLSAVSSLLAARYNVEAVDGPVGDAIASVQAAIDDDGDALAALDAAQGVILERELYRWRPEVITALKELRAAIGEEAAPANEEEAPPAPPRKRVLSDLKLDELVALATANEIAVPEKAKKADVFKLLKDAKVAVPQEVTGDGTGESLPPAPEGRPVGDVFEGHLVEGHIDEDWLATEFDLDQLRELAGEWDLTVADDATAADLTKAIAAETVYYDPDEPAE